MLGRVVVGLWLAILAVVPAAAQDYSRGMEAYRQGNYLAAVGNWRPLAERGHAPSQSSLGFLYNYGHGVEQNYRMALKWYRKAAEQGFAPAQYHLGFLYTKGLGVDQDYVKAHMWFELGAVGGLSYSDKNRAIVARRMTPTQIAEARELARNWRAAAEQRLRGRGAGKKATRKKASAQKAGARKAAAKKAAAQNSHRRQAEKASPQPAASVEAHMADRVSPVSDAGAGAAVGSGGKTPLRKASASVPVAKKSETPAPQTAAVAGDAKTKPVETAAVQLLTRAPTPQPALKAEKPAPKAEKMAPHSAKTPQAGKSKKGSGPVLLQLGASKSEPLALKAIARITKKHAGILGDVKIRAERKDLGSRGVYYRLRAGPIADAAAGRALCSMLVASGQSCLLLKP